MCDERERLIGYVYGECDDAERQRVGGHLAHCEVCQEEVGGLRRVREDLLAWGVPEHGSVWSPFAPARATPWWREVPGWALAAAASLTFVVGAAGGILTTAVVSGETAMAATVPAVQVLPDSVTEAELAAFEQRVLEQMRAQYLMSQTANPSGVEAVPANVVTSAELDALEQWFAGMMGQVIQDLGTQVERINEVEGKVTKITANMPGPGNQ
jgi:anti-sigma factor RsiW